MKARKFVEEVKREVKRSPVKECLHGGKRGIRMNRINTARVQLRRKRGENMSRKPKEKQKDTKTSTIQ